MMQSLEVFGAAGGDGAVRGGEGDAACRCSRHSRQPLAATWQRGTEVRLKASEGVGDALHQVGEAAAEGGPGDADGAGPAGRSA